VRARRAAVALVAFALCAAAAARAAPPSAAARIGAWLPQYYLAPDPSGRQKYPVLDRSHVDRFVYGGGIIVGYGGATQPAGGTYAVTGAGTKAYNKARVVYDSAHRIAFYSVGCCSLWSIALASANPPPGSVARADLAAAHTQRGFALGDTVARVRRINGPAVPLPVPAHPGLTSLSYQVNVHAPSCAQWQNFVFRNGKLISIELVDGC
jgi:hypothetical protein